MPPDDFSACATRGGMDAGARPQELRVLFFGHLPEITGMAETVWAWEENAGAGLTVAALLEQLHSRWPALRAHDSSIRVAVNLEYAGRETPIPPGAEVAVMPPVQGG